jgi:hypothetical protein
MDKQIAKMIEFAGECGDAKKLRQIAANAAVWQSIHALEDVLKQERGKAIVLSRTRQKIGRQGVVGCVADVVLGRPRTDLNCSSNQICWACCSRQTQ